MTKSNTKSYIITVVRIAIGWHFLFEGISKFLTDNWSSYNFLTNTNSFLSPFYHWLASSPFKIHIVDFLNVYGLIIIGLALFLGIFIRYAAIRNNFV